MNSGYTCVCDSHKKDLNQERGEIECYAIHTRTIIYFNTDFFQIKILDTAYRFKIYTSINFKRVSTKYKKTGITVLQLSFFKTINIRNAILQ